MKKKKKERKRKNKVRSTAKVIPGSLGNDTYREFGPLGEDIERAHYSRWRVAAKQWKTSRILDRMYLQKLPADFTEAFAARAGDASYLYCFLEKSAEQCSMRGLVRNRKFDRAITELWNSTVRYVFDPVLPGTQSLTSTFQLRFQRATVVDCYSAGQRADDDILLQASCYGAFSRKEMEYIRNEHPRILDAACGAGYFIAEYLRQGGDALGFDNNLYQLSDGTHCEWTSVLLEHGQVITGDQSDMSDSLFRDRSLLLSWPVSVTPFAFEILERYTRLGGKHFLFKPGGFLTFKSMVSLKSIENFFQVLKEHWKQVHHPLLPTWRSAVVENNMFVFERK